MQSFNLPIKNKSAILSLGAESAGNFSVYFKGKIYFSEDFGDLLIDANFNKFKNELNKFLKKNKIKPEIILTDLHPLYKTTLLGQELAKKYKATHVQVQHHTAHIFSCVGENMSISNFQFPISKQIENSAIGIALDGTGYGLDGNIWGGEVLMISSASKVEPSVLRRFNLRKPRIARIGHLENQTMIGGDLAVQEPARMLISILSKFLPKEKIWNTLNNVSRKHGHSQMTHFKNFYTRNQFELLYNQLQGGFNCQETSSTGRILDAISILLGFCQNERKFKHAPVILLEKNSTIPYHDLKPKIIKNFNKESGIMNYELSTTYLFKYLFKYLHRDKKRLAATAQLYIAEGLYKLIKKCHPELVSGSKKKIPDQVRNDIYLAGGIANNKIISEYLISKGAIVNSSIPRGDAGISFGQIVYFLLQ